MVATMTGMQEARIACAGPRVATDGGNDRRLSAMGQILGPLLVSLVADLQYGMNALLTGASGLLLASAVALLRR